MTASRLALRFVALGYLAATLVVPVAFILSKTLEPGPAAVWRSITTPSAVHAFWLTIEVAAIAVPLTTLFGMVCALVLARTRVPGRSVLEALIDLPFAV